MQARSLAVAVPVAVASVAVPVAVAALAVEVATVAEDNLSLRHTEMSW